MTEHYVAGMNNASGGTVVNGDLDEASKLIICHAEEDLPLVQEKKKSVSSSTEKKRKDKIRYWINKIGEQLPPVENPDKDRVGRSTLEIVEKAWSYIVQLKEAADPTCRDKIRNTYLDEIKKLKNDLEYWKQQAYKLHQKLETAENPPTSAVNQPQNTIPQSTTSTTEKLTNTTVGTNDNSTSVKDSEKSKSKTKRRNTISLQLENLKKQQQENANSMNSMQQQQQQGNQELLAPGMMNNFPTMMDGGATANQQQVFNQQQMLMNSMIFGGGSGGVMVPNSNGGMVLTNTALGSHGNNTGMVVNGSVGGGSGISLQGNQIQGQSSEAKGQSAAEAGAGLLQLAMQDAGITPSSQSAPSEDQNVTNVSSVSMATGSNSDTQPSALHTLASIASNTQSLSNASQVPASQVQVNSLVTQGGSSAPTATTQSINSSAPIMATGQGQGGINATMSNNGTMMNMSFMNGQQMQPGNMMPGGQNPGFNPMAATQQIMFVNDQGVPCVANIPMGIDPASLGIPNNAKQVMGIDKSGNVIVQNLQKDQGQINQMNEQAILANTLAQQQMNLALQGQMPGQFQGQNNVAIGNPAALVQPSMNNQLQLNQQMMQPMGGQLASGQLTQTNQGLILPASQTGNLLTVNSVPTQQSQLPQALLLPNGQIIPVVSNPNLVAGQQGQMASMMPPNPQQITGGNIQQRLPLPAGMVQGDPNNQVIMTSSGQIQIGQPQMSLPAGGVVNVSSAPPSSQGQGLLMTTSSVVPVSPSSSSTTASQSIALHTSTAGINATSSSVVISGTSAPVLQGSKVQGQDGNSNSGPIFSSVTSSDASVIPIVPTSQMMTVTSSGDPSGANGAPIAVLNPQLQSQLSGQLSGSTAPILLTMNCNGQATSILVDPTTMHVLGTVQTQQPAAGQNTTPATSTSSTPPSKKGKKNPQRAICPKPQGNKAIGGAIPTSGATLLPAGLLVPTSAPTQGMWLTKEGEQPMDIVIPSQSTTTAPTKKAGNKSRSKSGKQKGNTENQGNTGGGSTQENAGASETDILAKAAESIFSSEISPGNFYNPANEDNPLQIDTSVGEGEEDNSGSGSPVKDFKSNKSKSKKLCSSAEEGDSEKNMSELSSLSDTDRTASKSQNDLHVSVDQKSQEEENELLEMFKDTVNDADQLNKATDSSITSDPLEDILLELKESNAQETQKKTKKGKRNEKEKSDNFQLFADSALKEIDTSNKTLLDKGEKVRDDSKKRDQSEEKDLIDLPDSITFSATDLPDVLDQVEQLGATLKQPSPSTNTKKSKKKGRSDNSEQEPVSKKRKKNSAKDKAGDPNTNLSQLTKSSNSMSVYDFEDDDFSTPLFQVGTPRLPNTTTPSGKSNATDKTSSASSQSPLYSMPILSEPTVSASTTSLFEDVATPKKRQSKQRGKKNDAKNDSSSVNKTFSSSASEKTTSLMDSEIALAKSVSNKSKDNKRTEVKTSLGIDKEKSTKNSDIMDSFGFDNIHSEPEKFDAKKDSSPKDLSPLFGSSEPKSRKIDKEIEKPNLNEPLFGPFNDSHKSGGMQENDFNQQSRDSLPSITATNPLTLDTSDIDSDVNNIFGLSPRMISPTPSLGNKSKQPAQKSPQLQTPKSTSPVSRISPVPMVTSNLGTTTHQSQILPMANEQIMSHAPTTSSVISSSSGLQYSAESLLGSHSKSLSSASSNPFSHNISSSESTSSGKSIDTLSASGKVSEDKQSALRPRSIYSAENFVQSSRNDLTKSSTNKSVPSLGQPPSDVSPSLSSFTRNDSSDGFNFANIGHILSTPTTTSNSFIDTLTASSIITTTSSSDKSSPSTEFTFTLTNVTTTVSTSSSPLMSSAQTSSSSSSMAGQGSVQGQGSSFPFYAPQQSPQRSMHQSPKRATQPQPSPQHRSPQQPKTPVTSASPQRSGGQMGNPHQGSHRPQVNMPSFDLDLQSNSMGSQMPPAAVPHNDMTRSDRDAGERIPNMSNISDSSYSYGLNTSSQPLSQRTGPPPREQPPLFPNITVSTHEGPLNMGINKSHSEMRNSHKRINEMNQRNVPPKSQTNERASSYSMQPFYATPNFPSSSNPLETAPLRHPPLISGDDRPGVARSYDPIFPPSHSQSFNPVGQNFSNGRYDSNSVTQSFPPHDSSGTQPLSHTPPSQNMEGRKSANSSSNQNPKHSKSSRSQQMPTTSQTRAMNGPSQSRSGPTPPQVPPPPSHRPTPPQQQPQASAAQSRPKSTSRSSKQSQKKKMMYGMESDLPPHPAMFDPTRSLTPAYLPIPTQALSPPSRNMQNEGTSLFGPSNLFGSSSRKSAGGPQNSDLSTPFNPLFPPARPQNGLGFNFQPGFGMNSMHGPMSNSAQITPHSGSVTVTPHMSNFTFPSIFSDPNNSTQNDSLNISPIKFPPNPMLPHQGMDPNSLHHAHQQTSSLYHQHRTHPPSVIHNMNIPSILGHNHHGFDSRGMTQGINTSVAPPFPGHSHPSFGMPPLNFSMHDH